MGSFRDSLEYLFNQGMRTESPLAADAVQKSASILVKELTAELIGRLDEAGALGSSRSGRQARLVRSAEDLVLARLDRPLTVGELAARLGVSGRGQEYAFQRVRGAGPRTVLGQLRLERAVQRLADPTGERCPGSLRLVTARRSDPLGAVGPHRERTSRRQTTGASLAPRCTHEQERKTP